MLLNPSSTTPKLLPFNSLIAGYSRKSGDQTKAISIGMDKEASKPNTKTPQALLRKVGIKPKQSQIGMDKEASKPNTSTPQALLKRAELRDVNKQREYEESGKREYDDSEQHHDEHQSSGGGTLGILSPGNILKNVKEVVTGRGLEDDDERNHD
ncbi:hypothetical protein IFM89_035156 [Coptis chinensis]|uniref:Uncharacterized protein n=1 Tax=Coptis chinensis TaxID=261450 RepID=A0A835ITQ5_9MAGN|nr:hypothetical protein IFM89_035156 [Coptis chinensis]